VFADGQILEREQAHGAVQGAEPDRGADKDVVPEQADQVEEAAGVQAEDRAPARILPTGAALRVAVRAALLLPGGGGCGCGDGRVHGELVAVRDRKCASKLRLRSSAAATADDHFDGTRRRVTGTRRVGDGGGRTSSGLGQNGTPTPSPSAPSQPPPSPPPTEIKI